MGTWELKLPGLIWIIIILFVIVLFTNHVNGLWVAGWVWHAAGAIIAGLNRGLTALRTGG
jgi:succinate dehydrogenase/fumarate reductase cytochrome b subunit